MGDTILVLNAGSSSLKFQLFDVEGEAHLIKRLKGQVDGIGTHPRLQAKNKDGKVLADATYPSENVADAAAALDMAITWLQQQLGGRMPSAIGHRVAHGGPDFDRPVMIDENVLNRLERLTPLAPLHQPHNLSPIRAIRARRPSLPQVACFDTAFHGNHKEVAQRYAIPDALHREGVRRYGFHGLSYEYIAKTLPQVAPPLATGRVVVAHLGSGASMCALKSGRSIDSTMGFTALDGLPMGTRSGQIDPGVLLYLLNKNGWDAARLETFLYKECGLKGLSGISNDMRDLLAAKSPLAKLAIDYFVYRILHETGALAASMEGIEGFVFTGGIGENAPEIRSRVCHGLAWLGLECDADANCRNAPRISSAKSRISAWVIPTDEERMIAEHTLELHGALIPA